mgnify:CR=1 FL=1
MHVTGLEVTRPPTPELPLGDEPARVRTFPPAPLGGLT